jgi:hypothetical protein
MPTVGKLTVFVSRQGQVNNIVPSQMTLAKWVGDQSGAAVMMAGLTDELHLLHRRPARKHYRQYRCTQYDRYGMVRQAVTQVTSFR